MENVRIKAQSRVGVRNSEQGAVQGLRLTVQWDGGLDLGEVIMTLLNTPEFGGKSPGSFPEQVFRPAGSVQCRRRSAGDHTNRHYGSTR